MALRWPHLIRFGDAGSRLMDAQGDVLETFPSWPLQCAAYLRGTELQVNDVRVGDNVIPFLPSNILNWEFATSIANYRAVLDLIVKNRAINVSQFGWEVTGTSSARNKEYADERPNFSELIIRGDYSAPNNPFENYAETEVNSFDHIQSSGFLVETVKITPDKAIIRSPVEFFQA